MRRRLAGAVGRQHAWNCAITPVLPRIADLSASDGLFMDSLISSIAQADEAAKERVRAFLEGRANKVSKQ